MKVKGFRVFKRAFRMCNRTTCGSVFMQASKAKPHAVLLIPTASCVSQNGRPNVFVTILSPFRHVLQALTWTWNTVKAGATPRCILDPELLANEVAAASVSARLVHIGLPGNSMMRAHAVLEEPLAYFARLLSRRRRSHNGSEHS